MLRFILNQMPAIALLLLIKTDAFADNIINISQISVGDNNQVGVSISGGSNLVDFSLSGSENRIDVSQVGYNGYIGFTSIYGSAELWGGDLSGSYNAMTIHQYCLMGGGCAPNRFEFHIEGDMNTLQVAQGYDQNLEINPMNSGGASITLDLHGNNNILNLSQNNNVPAFHDMNIEIFSDNNDVNVHQSGEVGASVVMGVYNNGNFANIIQSTSGGSHSASVILSGEFSTSLNLTQTGAVPLSYELNQNCVTFGGCSVTVVQGD